jgi:cytochrome c-type biogenesis protein CcmH/NrfG
MARPTSQPKPRRNRLVILLLLGLLLVGGAVILRSSRWGQERQLEKLSLEQLILAAHDRPNDALVFSYLGAGFAKAGRLKDAEHALQHSIDLDRKNPAAHFALATVMMQQGQAITAAMAFQEAVKLSPQDLSVHLGLAQAFYLAGSPSRAIPHLQKIVDKDPKRAVAWYFLGKMYGESHQSDKALDAMRRAVALDGKNASYHRDLGQLLAFYSRNEEAEASYLQAAKLDPKDAQTHFRIGQLYVRMGSQKEKDAERELKEALRLDPAQAECHFQLGQIYERQSRWSLAADQYEKTRQLDPSMSRPVYHLGLCYTKLGRAAEGAKLIKGFKELLAVKLLIEDLDSRAKADPDSKELALRLARLYRKYGDYDNALVHYSRVLKMAPSDAAARKESDACRVQALAQNRNRPAPAAAPPGASIPMGGGTPAVVSPGAAPGEGMPVSAPALGGGS